MKIPFLSQFFKSRDKPKNYYIGTDFRFKGERWGVHLHSWLESYLTRGGAGVHLRHGKLSSWKSQYLADLL